MREEEGIMGNMKICTQKLENRLVGSSTNSHLMVETLQPYQTTQHSDI